MEFIDYYDVMGVAPDAEPEAIKRAYRKLARKYHPDVSEESDAEGRFKAIGEAWAVLKDPERRREYDELRELHARGGFRPGAGANGGGGFRPPPGWGGASPGSDGRNAGRGGGTWQGEAADFSDFFRDIFGEAGYAGGGARGGGARGGFGGGSRRGEDVHGALSISLQDAHDGASLPLTLRSQARRADGSVGIDEKTLQVKIPAGIVSGQRIRLRGQGGAGLDGGEAGDLYVEITIEPDARFALDGRDVTLVLPVAPWEAALGATLDVPTLGGGVRLNVPARSSGGKRLRLKGRGLPAGKGGEAGDQYVVLRIELPQPDTDAQRALYEEMRRAWPDHDPRASLGTEARR